MNGTGQQPADASKPPSWWRRQEPLTKIIIGALSGVALLVAVLVIVLAVTRDGTETHVVYATTIAVAPIGTSTSTVATTSTSATSTTCACVPSTASPPLELQTRIGEFHLLLEGVGMTGLDKRTEIAGFLWPPDEVLEAVAELQQYWAAGPSEANMIAAGGFAGIVRLTLCDEGDCAVAVEERVLMGKDGLTTRGLAVASWTKQDGQWYMTTSFEPLAVKEGGRQAIDTSVRVGSLAWSPFEVDELKHLSLRQDGPEATGMFLVVRMYVMNSGESADIPGSYSVALYDKDGVQLQESDAYDRFFSGEVADRQKTLDPGWSREVRYCFEVPEGLDLAALQYEIPLPGD